MPSWLNIEHLHQIAEQHRIIGTILAIMLPFMKSFLPFLPLTAFIVANAAAYGLWVGFFFSWIGVVTGSYLAFLVIRKFGHNRFFGSVTNRPSIKKLITWVEMQGFTPFFVLLCFPFTPTSVVTIVAGLSNLKKKSYLLTLICAKFVMIFIVSWVGSDLQSLFTKPWKTVFIVLMLALMWIGGKMFEKHSNKKIEDHLRHLHEQS